MFPGRWSKEEICKFVNCVTWGIKGFSHEFLIIKEMQQISYMGRTCDINNHTFIKIWIFLFPKTLILWNAAVQEKCIPANIYLLNVDDRRTRKMFGICSKLTIITPEQCHWRRFSVFIVNYEHNSHLFLLFLLLTLSMYLSAGMSFPMKCSNTHYGNDLRTKFLIISSRRISLLTLLCLVSNKRSHVLKQTCSFQLQACLSMCDLLVDTRH